MSSHQFLLISERQVISSCSYSLHFDLWFDQPPVSHCLLCVYVKLLLTHTISLMSRCVYQLFTDRYLSLFVCKLLLVHFISLLYFQDSFPAFILKED